MRWTRKRIEQVWREQLNLNSNVALVASETEWRFYEALLLEAPVTHLRDEYERIRSKPEFEASLEEQERFDTIATILK